MTSRDAHLPRIAGLGEIAPQFSAILCDIWGVVHNGVRAHDAAATALRAFREQRGPVILITNAPRPRLDVQAQLRGFGVPDDAYDLIVSSGDVTRELLAQRQGKTVFHLGPDRDHALLNGLDLQRADAARADFVLCSGLFDDDRETPDDYAAMLAALRARDLDMICANPDIVVERGERLVYCAGALARAYEQLGGRAFYAGKPHAPIYQSAFSELSRLRGGEVPLQQILAIGDGLKTDLQGAANAGLQALFVLSGIHGAAHEDQAGLFAQLAQMQVRFAGVMTHLNW